MLNSGRGIQFVKTAPKNLAFKNKLAMLLTFALKAIGEGNVTEDECIEVNISLLEYYKYIEKGRAAGKYAPISAIENWVKIKPLIPRPNANGKLPTTKQLAYLVNRKIYTEGIEPKPILQENIYKTMSNFYEEIEKAIKEDLSGDFEIMLKELEL